MIRISKPYLQQNSSFVRLVADIDIDGQSHVVWAEVDKAYKDYLCYERSDAFVIVLLRYAIAHNHNIVCEAPMGEDLYYQINTYLIDAMVKWSNGMHRITISADIDTTDLPCAGKVGTGISCGIDSLHTIALHSDVSLMRHKLTHLTFNNVGSHGEGEHAKRLYEERKKRAESFCKEYGYNLVEVNSNVMDEIYQFHYFSHTFSSIFTVYCLQKLYSIYYYASGYTINEFSIKNTEYTDPAHYDLLLLNAFSTDKLKIYSEGMVYTRLEKTKTVVNYRPSYKYLNVCVRTANNCSKCEKCCRTLLALDALNKLDLYENVFDIQYYKSHKTYYLKMLVAKNYLHENNYVELYPFFKQEISVLTKLLAVPLALKLYRRKRHECKSYK